MKKCYLCCAADKKLTDDHVPPKGFFPKPRPKNLITVKCCIDCHASLSLDDEAFRAWVAQVHNASPAGKAILREKVFGSSFKRSPKLKENVAKYLGMRTMNTMGMEISVPTISIPDDRAERFVIRIIKGLLTTFYPDYDYSKDAFSIVAPVPSRESLQHLSSIAKHCIKDSRGNGVFDFWRLVSSEAGGGAWILLFYDEACFYVLHSSKEKWKDGEPPNTPMT